MPSTDKPKEATCPICTSLQWSADGELSAGDKERVRHQLMAADRCMVELSRP